MPDERLTRLLEHIRVLWPERKRLSVQVAVVAELFANSTYSIFVDNAIQDLYYRMSLSTRGQLVLSSRITWHCTSRYSFDADGGRLHDLGDRNQAAHVARHDNFCETIVIRLNVESIPELLEPARTHRFLTPEDISAAVRSITDLSGDISALPELRLLSPPTTRTSINSMTSIDSMSVNASDPDNGPYPLDGLLARIDELTDP